MPTTVDLANFADHPTLVVTCCGVPMTMFASDHERTDEETVHWIGRGCYGCGSTLITSYFHRPPED